jgi:hypothetical protein
MHTDQLTFNQSVAGRAASNVSLQFLHIEDIGNVSLQLLRMGDIKHLHKMVHNKETESVGEPSH